MGIVSRMREKAKKFKDDSRRKSTRDLMEIEAVTDHGLRAYHGNLVYFIVEPTNLSVLSEDALTARVYALMTVLKGQTEIEMMALNSRENFEDNKRFLRKQIQSESVPAIHRLLEKDLANLDRIQVQTVTAREFLLAVRFQGKVDAEMLTRVGQIEKIIGEQSITVRRATEDDLKKLLGVYYEQNVTTEKFEDFDGERWVIFGEQ